MSRRLGYVVGLLAGVLVGLGLSGCVNDPGPGPAPQTGALDQDDGKGHDADTPLDFPSSVAALKDCYGKIKEAFEADKPGDAHVPLHDVGHLLEGITKAANEADLESADRDAVTVAVGRMFDAYGTIDGAMHAGKEPDYDAVAEDLDKGMTDLEDVLTKLDSQSES